MTEIDLAEKGYLAKRNSEIWVRYMAGASPQSLAEIYDLAPATINNIVAKRSKALPQESVDEIRLRSIAFMNHLGDKVMQILERPAPAIVTTKGTYVYDPDTGEVMRDYGTQLQAILVALRVLERIHKVGGLERPQQVEINIATQAAIEQAERVIKGNYLTLVGGVDAQEAS
ncbi:MAG TPA: hypothetical protein VJW23_19545 [Propionibacteriaceae bacterium]|nr:hypothetical protein [Propionibacteriaceae bacterium]